MSQLIEQSRSPLVEQPLKTSAATGATLACMGLADSIPLMHGSQGCGAFAKVYLIQHFREPIPLQNTAIDHIAAVMGGDDNLSQALQLLCDTHQPKLIMVMTTGLTEMQGCDLDRVIREFRQQYPQYQQVYIVPVTTPDFVGTMQTGFADAIQACVKQMLLHNPIDSATALAKRNNQQLNVFCSVALTSADVELIEHYCGAFGFSAIMLPNLSLSLDGHLAEQDYSVTATGGTSIKQLADMAYSAANLVVGPSMSSAAHVLEQQCGMPSYHLGMAMGLAETDQLILILSRLSGKPVPAWLSRQRKRLQDSLLDTHFLLSNSTIALALEPDAACGYSSLLSEVGAQIKLVVSTLNSRSLKQINAQRIIIGDLSDLSQQLGSIELVVGNTHCANLCEPETPVLRAGYPCHDRFGNSDVLQVGYEGARARLFALANLLKAYHQDEVPAHVSAYRFGPEQTLTNQQ
ncbi:nitrogenase iron-molybdenum cofactor biosynthesis protein NifN [Agarivorans sp. TSD2052]|uniref:nitrogenase iron-molybdenum cofactor biosynthesis protein NifN n=1 Tax=Agarivorans sp. TSD2052 TaxID=2937286 RepID=UPI00200CDF09|nr:nitrogenase iron-molybdenum cofactor biosynthesis protein NifN [Agarivorans sp. TSD2052]UPW20342.1 nitrogenase iron-molybdenum cofactor biosynthesis protein NifN [Agarivorans sp. TSD2052]